MTQEEKAKRYDEAIKIAKEINNEQQAQPFNVMTRVFPELADSEDERIRKWLISHIKECAEVTPSDNGEYRAYLQDKVLAWLEKQGENKPVIEMKTPEESLDIDSDTYNKIVDECIYGEQNPADKVETKFKIGDTIRLKNGDGLEWTVKEVLNNGCYTIVCDDRDGFIQFDDNWELVEQKPTDKVESKFRVGDWIVSNEHPNSSNSLMRIVKVGLTDYLCRYYNGQTKYCCEFIDKNYHLWTIQDAKDGDVLALEWTQDNDASHWEKIVIFKDLNKDGVEGYGCTFKNEKLAINEEVPYYSKTWTMNLHPATKEQHDLLFSKMKEAGYEWDAEKKELNKIIDENQIKKNRKKK